MHAVTIVGVGRVGGSLALALSKSGFEIGCLVSNNPGEAAKFATAVPGNPLVTTVERLASLETEIVFVTTQDSKIKPAARLLAAIPNNKGKFAFHASGALSNEELKPFAEKGWETGSIHPLISINDPIRGAENLKDAYFAVEGTDIAVRLGKDIVKSLGGRSFEIGSDSKTLYHAAAVVACGHLVALIDTSRRMLAMCGLDEKTAGEVLNPLIESTIANLRHGTAANALTGPFARGDADVIERHLQKIRENADDDIEDVYRLLGRLSLEIADSRISDRDKIARIQKIILLDNNNLR